MNVTKTKVPDPASWTNVKSTYTAITNKLNTSGTTQEKTDAVDYWMARLKEDRALVNAGKPPATDT